MTQGRAARCREAQGHPHGTLAAGTGSGVSWPCRLAHGAAPEEEAHAAQGPEGGRAQKAKVAGGNEALGQNMEEPAANEFARLNGVDLPASVSAVLVT